MADPITNTSLLIKYKTARFSDEQIARRMGISVQEVQRCWEEIQEAIAHIPKGLPQLIQQFDVMCTQYQLLGTSLKAIGTALGNPMVPSEIRALIAEDPEQTLRNLLENSIILRPYVAVDPVAVLEQDLKDHQNRN